MVEVAAAAAATAAAATAATAEEEEGGNKEMKVSFCRRREVVSFPLMDRMLWHTDK